MAAHQPFEVWPAAFSWLFWSPDGPDGTATANLYEATVIDRSLPVLSAEYRGCTSVSLILDVRAA